MDIIAFLAFVLVLLLVFGYWIQKRLDKDQQIEKKKTER